MSLFERVLTRWDDELLGWLYLSDFLVADLVFLWFGLMALLVCLACSCSCPWVHFLLIPGEKNDFSLGSLG